MAELLPYQTKIIEKEKSMSNQELFDEVLSQAGGDDLEGCFTPKGFWEYEYLESKLRERLANWLTAEHSVHPTLLESADLQAAPTLEHSATSQTDQTPPQRR